MPIDKAKVLEALAWLKSEVPHADCEDCWYSCSTICCDENRKSDECDCGADKENAMKRTLLAYLEDLAT